MVSICSQLAESNLTRLSTPPIRLTHFGTAHYNGVTAHQCDRIALGVQRTCGAARS